MTGASRGIWLVFTAAFLAGLGAEWPRAQSAAGFENLQFFPQGISREELVQQMREFSFALDVRCEYCHVGGPGLPSEAVSFASDEKVTKRKARYMLRMVESINGSLLASVPQPTAANPAVECATCHRGLPVPKLLGAELEAIIAAEGPEAGVERYRELRQEAIFGKYNFGEWTINELARKLEEQGDAAAAIAMLEMNAAYYPESIAIDLALGNLYEAGGQRDRAVARYRRVLERQPDNARARERLEVLERQPH